jgi:hypothetical protein
MSAPDALDGTVLLITRRYAAGIPWLRLWMRRMTYYVESRWGGSEDEPDQERMRELLAELDTPDEEHPDTWLVYDGRWSLSVHETGLVVWEDEEDPRSPRHMVRVSREKALDLWIKLSQGDLKAIEAESWQPGYRPPYSEEEKNAMAKAEEKARLEAARGFYEILGEERPDVICRKEGCKRGAIHQSVLCRVHHFENVWRRPCPFSD